MNFRKHNATMHLFHCKWQGCSLTEWMHGFCRFVFSLAMNMFNISGCVCILTVIFYFVSMRYYPRFVSDIFILGFCWLHLPFAVSYICFVTDSQISATSLFGGCIPIFAKHISRIQSQHLLAVCLFWQTILLGVFNRYAQSQVVPCRSFSHFYQHLHSWV